MTSTNQSEKLPELSSSEKARYSRHIILPEVGISGQQRLKNGRILIIGAGGLGSPAAMYLAAAGVGKLGLVDFDAIDISNLQRQILHSTEDVGTSKCQSAQRRLAQINPEIAVVLHEERVSSNNVKALVDKYDVIIDATDNFSTRYLINDACVLSKKPNVYGAIYRFEGQASLFGAGGPCYRCLFPYPPPAEAVPNCAEGGVLGVLAGVIGVIQATEAIKYLLGTGTTLMGKLLMYDALEMSFHSLTITRNADCPICGENPSIFDVEEAEVSCQADTSAASSERSTVADDFRVAPHRSSSTAGNGISSSPVPESGIRNITASKLNERLLSGESIFLLDVRNPEEYSLCHLENSVLIPVNDLPNRINELDQSKEIVVYCKSGGRSLKAAQLLLSNGFLRITNLEGGILSWISAIDPSICKY